jgi:hypothetical protein
MSILLGRNNLFYHKELRDFTRRTTEINYIKGNDITGKIIGCAINVPAEGQGY